MAIFFWPGTAVQRYRANLILEEAILFSQSEVQRYKLQNKTKKWQIYSGKVEQYRGTKEHSSKSVKENIKMGQVQRYRGKQLEFPCYIIDLLEFLLKIA